MQILFLNCEYQFDCDEINAVKVIGTDILFLQDGIYIGVKKVSATIRQSDHINH
jgi:hypothetical protein